jgi:predicted flap endonuclease-1-like 5' DNA nuclease
MIAIIQENWLAFALVLLIGLLVAWWIWGRGRSDRRVRHHAPDALDEGAAPAARNQAFIDAPSAAAAVTAPLAATGPDILGGIGEIAAWGAAHEVANAQPPQEPAAIASAPEPTRFAALETLPPSPPAARDDLTRIKGVGPKLSARLAELGVISFAQIAAWNDADLARVDSALGAFAGRPARDNWVAQCRFLAEDDLAGYEAQFGKL